MGPAHQVRQKSIIGCLVDIFASPRPVCSSWHGSAGAAAYRCSCCAAAERMSAPRGVQRDGAHGPHAPAARGLFPPARVLLHASRAAPLYTCTPPRWGAPTPATVDNDTSNPRLVHAAAISAVRGAALCTTNGLHTGLLVDDRWWPPTCATKCATDYLCNTIQLDYHRKAVSEMGSDATRMLLNLRTLLIFCPKTNKKNYRYRI